MWAPQDMKRAARQAKLDALTASQRGHRNSRALAFLAGVNYGVERAAQAMFPGCVVQVRNTDPGQALDAFDRWEESEGR